MSLADLAAGNTSSQAPQGLAALASTPSPPSGGLAALAAGKPSSGGLAALAAAPTLAPSANPESPRSTSYLDLATREGGPNAYDQAAYRFAMGAGQGLAGIPKQFASAAGGLAESLMPPQTSLQPGLEALAQKSPSYIAELLRSAKSGAAGLGENYGTGLMRDMAMSGLMLVPGGQAPALAFSAGLGGTEAALQAPEHEQQLSQYLAPSEPRFDQELAKTDPLAAAAKYARESTLKSAWSEATSPEALDAYLQAGLMAAHPIYEALRKIPGSAQSTPESAPAPDVTPPEPTLFNQQPTGGLWGAVKKQLPTYFLNAEDARAKALDQDLQKAYPDMDPQQRADAVQAAMSAERKLQESRTLGEEQGRILERAQNPTPLPPGGPQAADALAPSEASAKLLDATGLGVDKTGALSPEQSRRLGQMLESLPKPVLTPEQLRDLPNDLQPKSIQDRLQAYRDAAQANAATAAPNDPVLQKAYLDAVSWQRLGEDFSGRDQSTWFNYQRNARELAPVNAAEAAARADTANRLTPEGALARERAKETLSFAEKKLAPKTPEQILADAQAVQKAQERLRKLSPTDLNAAEALRGKVLVEKQLRQERLAALQSSVPEAPDLVKPTKEQAAAFKPEKASGAETTIKNAEGQPLLESPNTPGARQRTVFLPEKGTASERMDLIKEQPAQPATDRRILSPEEARAEKISAQQKAALEEASQKLSKSMETLGMVKSDYARQAKIASALRVIEKRGTITTDQIRAFENARDEAARILAEKPSAATKAALDKAGIRADTAGEAYKQITDILQQQYSRGAVGYRRHVWPDYLSSNLLSDIERSLGADLGLREQLRSSTKVNKEIYAQRQVAPEGKLPIAYPGLGQAEAFRANVFNGASEAFAKDVAASPFARKPATPGEADLLEKQGWQKISSGAQPLQGYYVSPEIYKAMSPKLELGSPSAVSRALSKMTSWMARNSTAGRWSTAVMNGVSMNIAMAVDLGLNPVAMARAWKRGLTAANDPVYWADIRKLGGTSLVGEPGRTPDSLRLPEPTPSQFTGEGTTPYPSTQETADLYRNTLEKNKTWFEGLLDSVDTIMDTQSALLKAAGATPAAVYNNPKLMTEIFRNMEVAGRHGAYMELRDAGLGHEEAAKRVRDALVDYGNKSQFVKDLEHYALGGLGGRFAHYSLAMASRGLSLMTDPNPVVVARALAIPAAITLLNQKQDDKYVQDQKDAAVKAGKDPAQAEKDARKEIDQRERLLPDYMQGAMRPWAINMGKDANGNWNYLDIGRGVPYVPGAQMAQGVAMLKDDQELSRNPLLALAGFTMPVAPALGAIANKDPFSGAAIMPATEKGNLAIKASNPENLQLMQEYLTSRYLPSQFPGLGSADTEAAFLARKNQPGEDISFRGALGMGRTEGQRMASQLFGVRPVIQNTGLQALAASGKIEDVAKNGVNALLNSRLSKSTAVTAAQEALAPRIREMVEKKFPSKE